MFEINVFHPQHKQSYIYPVVFTINQEAVKKKNQKQLSYSEIRSLFHFGYQLWN